MDTTELRERIATRRTLGGSHDATQDILEGLLAKVEELGERVSALEERAKALDARRLAKASEYLSEG